MTLGIALMCNDGVVVGSDKKTVQNKGVHIQDTTQKIIEFELGNQKLLCCYAGSKTVAERMVARIHPENEHSDMSFATYMSEVVENRIPAFCRQHESKHGSPPNATIAIASITDNDNPIISTVYANGTFDYEDEYTAIGSGSLIAEVFLRDSFCRDLDIKIGRQTVAYILQRVSEIDSRVDGIDVRSIDGDNQIRSVSPSFETGLRVANISNHNFDLDIAEDLDAVVNYADLVEGNR